jgi:hypothetical protein
MEMNQRSEKIGLKRNCIIDAEMYTESMYKIQ